MFYRVVPLCKGYSVSYKGGMAALETAACVKERNRQAASSKQRLAATDLHTSLETTYPLSK